MLRMTVEGVAFDHKKQTVVLLKDWEGHKLLPIWIGPAEARSIAIELEGAHPTRPLPHDLLLSIVASAQGRITRVVINDIVNATFLATIDIDTPGGAHHVDARPSDALAVAVRAKCPIFVDGGALNALIDAGEAGNAADLNLEMGSVPPSEEAAEPVLEDEDLKRFRRLLGD